MAASNACRAWNSAFLREAEEDSTGAHAAKTDAAAKTENSHRKHKKFLFQELRNFVRIQKEPCFSFAELAPFARFKKWFCAKLSLKALCTIEKIEHCQTLFVKYLKNRQKLPKGWNAKIRSSKNNGNSARINSWRKKIGRVAQNENLQPYVKLWWILGFFPS